MAHKCSVKGKLNSLSEMAKIIGCILELVFLLISERDLDLPTAMLKIFSPFFSDGMPTKSLPMNCKLSNLIGSCPLMEGKKHSSNKIFLPNNK